MSEEQHPPHEPKARLARSKLRVEFAQQRLVEGQMLNEAGSPNSDTRIVITPSTSGAQ